MLLARCADNRSDFLETARDELNGGNVIFYVLILFHSSDVFYTLSRLFVRPGFRLFCARLAVHYLAVYPVLGSLINKTSTATATSTTVV